MYNRYVLLQYGRYKKNDDRHEPRTKFDLIYRIIQVLFKCTSMGIETDLLTYTDE